MPDKARGKLYHKTPAWVSDGAIFHIRLRVNDSNALPLTEEHLAQELLGRDWKAFHKRLNGVRWQENFFDHRIRNREEFDEKACYIRMNPARKGLCQTAEDWLFVLDRTSVKSG